ncbi:hypothetical protein F4809DRAFT_610164 [Biscogniauxia mediterranea]|nr:hypothetical protein F4809DRAFT_610164 [Biscogniauxia mediterranea]
MAEIPDSESLEPLSSSSSPSSSPSLHDRHPSVDTDPESLPDSDARYRQQPHHQHNHNHHHHHHASENSESVLNSSEEDDEPDEDEDIDDYDYDDDIIADIFAPDPIDAYLDGEDGHYLGSDHDEELTDLSSPGGSHVSFHMADDNFGLDEFDDEEGLFVGDFEDEGDDDLLGLAPSPQADRRENLRSIWRAISLNHNNGGLRALQLMMDPAQRRPHERDELVHMEMGAPGNGRNHRPNAQRQPPQPTVIDLTGDDADSSPRQPNVRASRSSVNPRRRRSQQQSTPPRLSRSDGSYIGDPPVINLVSDSDDELAEVPPPRRDNNNNNNNENSNNNNNNNNINNNHYNNGHNHNAGRGVRNGRFGGMPRQGAQNNEALGHIPMQHIHHFLTQIPNMHMPIFTMLDRNNHRSMADRDLDDDLIIVDQRNRPPQPPPAHVNIPVHLDYLAVPFGPPQHGGGSAKPAHEPPKDAKEGFTRDTGEEVVAICPSCEQELAYDPDGDDDVPATPAKKPRTKKDKAEHHFWAVKACGHVYCKKCFDNRKPSARNPVQVGFRPDPKGARNKIICAVEECDSDVTSKTAWVGIFL